MAPSSSAKQHCRQFELAEIFSITEGFSAANEIGRGGFGRIYRGLLIIDNSSAIAASKQNPKSKKGWAEFYSSAIGAVKQNPKSKQGRAGFIDNRLATVAVKRRDPNSEQGWAEFEQEIETLSKLRHRNIISLIGYCDEQGEMILVYEYIANHTLEDHLHRRLSNGHSSLTYRDRISILIGVCQGLNHLQYGCPDMSIIHRDVKSSNILLNENLVPKVSDFGMAKQVSLDSSESHVWPDSFKGTFGYMDPYYGKNGRLSKASDTFAFGVLMLEVLSGRRAVFSENDEPTALFYWSSNREAHEIVDPSMSGIIPEGSLNVSVKVAKECLRDDPDQRPKLTQVLGQLESILQGIPNAPRVAPSVRTHGAVMPIHNHHIQPSHGYAAPTASYGNSPPESKRRIIDDNYSNIQQVIDALARAGLESSNLIIGIDFTKSNEWTGARSFHKRSLHHIGDELNPYEQAISIIGRTLSKFNEDNLIPCFGFGDASTHGRDVFSFFPGEGFCEGFEEVLSRYRELVPQLRLSGPTSFAPVIEMAITIVEQSSGQYHVLVIIADGQVTRSCDILPGQLSQEEKNTVDAIVKASEYPLSIILVGVGDGPWDMMREFDDNILARAFDNFQFVNFTDIMSKKMDPSHKEAEFALSAMMQLPSQYKATMELNILGLILVHEHFIVVLIFRIFVTVSL